MKRALLIALGAVAVLVVAAVAFGMMTMRVDIAYEPETDPAHRVQPVKFGHTNIYLIRGDDGYILVDTGMPGNPEKLDEVFAMAGVDPTEVRLIVATHGHLDHIGLLAHAKRITGAPVAAHAEIADMLRAGEYEVAVAQNATGRILNAMTSVLVATTGGEIEAVSPDILVEDNLDLGAYGVPGRIVHTPGHSPGSVAILLDTREALVGDMVRDEGEGRIGPGMFYTDKQGVIDGLRKVADQVPETIYLSHGDRIGAAQLDDAISALESQ